MKNREVQTWQRRKKESVQNVKGEGKLSVSHRSNQVLSVIGIVRFVEEVARCPAPDAMEMVMW
jgi:hypothetical protein